MLFQIKAASIKEARDKVAALTTLGATEVQLRAMAGSINRGYWRSDIGAVCEDTDVRFDASARSKHTFVLDGYCKLTPDPGAELTIRCNLPCFVLNSYR